MECKSAHAKIEELLKSEIAAIESLRRMDEQRAWELAKGLIRRDVEHGRSISDIKKGRQGRFDGIGYVSVGGRMGERNYPSDFIVVRRLGKREVHIAFKLRDIYKAVANALQGSEGEGERGQVDGD